MNEQLRIVLGGEVDCGKSTLIGRLLYDTDSISSQAKKELQKTCQDLGKDLEFAYLLDSFQEEREEEFTLDTTQAILKTKDREYLLIDVPGHRALLKNMLTGASYAEAAILVVDVKKILEEQTRRHLYILKFLGIEQIIVSINKMDSVSYDEKYFVEARRQVEKFLKEIKLYSNYIIPISAKEGENLLEKTSEMDWYKGLTLWEVLNTFTQREKIYDFRFSVQDIYEIKKDKVVVGTVVAGKINKGDSVKVSSLDTESKIKEIKKFGKHTNIAQAKESIGLVFMKLPPELKRGHVLYKGRSPVITSEIQAKIFCLSPLEVQEELLLRLSTQEVSGRISQIKESIDTASLEINKDVKTLNPNDVAEVVITTEKPLVMEKFQNLEELGRFILQKNSEVYAVGIII